MGKAAVIVKSYSEDYYLLIKFFKNEEIYFDDYDVIVHGNNDECSTR